MYQKSRLVPKKSFQYKMKYFIGKTIIYVIEYFLNFFIEKKIFFENEEFAWCKKFENNYEAIKKEYLKIKNEMMLLDVTQLSEEQFAVIEKDRWHFIPLFLYEHKVEKFCKLAPITTTLLEEVPNMTTAIFSTLSPHAKIKKHRGSYGGIMRYHFGLIVPERYFDCSIYFNDGSKKYSWKNGESVFFDDTFDHYVENNTDEERVVLYVDFIRPMPKIFEFISLKLIGALKKSPYVQNMIIKLGQHDG